MPQIRKRVREGYNSISSGENEPPKSYGALWPGLVKLAPKQRAGAFIGLLVLLWITVPMLAIVLFCLFVCFFIPPLSFS